MKSSKITGLLLEMLIWVFIFTIAGALILNMFLSARYTERMARDKTHAMYECQSEIEKMYVRLDRENDKSIDISKTPKSIYFDASWEVCEISQAVYAMEVSLFKSERPTGNMFYGSAVLKKLQPYPFINIKYSNLFSIDFKHFVLSKEVSQ